MFMRKCYNIDNLAARSKKCLYGNVIISKKTKLNQVSKQSKLVHLFPSITYDVRHCYNCSSSKSCTFLVVVKNKKDKDKVKRANTKTKKKWTNIHKKQVNMDKCHLE